MAVLGGFVKRSAAFYVDSEEVGAFFKQKVDGVDVAVFRGSEQRGATLLVGKIHVSLTAKKQSNRASVAISSCGEQRRAALVVLHVDRCAGVEKELCGG